MIYLVEPNREPVEALQEGCVAPDCGVLSSVCNCN